MPDLSPIEKLTVRVEILAEDVRDSRREIRELKYQFGEFVPAVSKDLTDKFFTPILRMMNLPDSLDISNNPDPLSMDSLYANIRKKEKG